MAANVDRHLSTSLPADNLRRRSERFTSLLDYELEATLTSPDEDARRGTSTATA